MGKWRSIIALVVISLNTPAYAGARIGQIFGDSFEDPEPVITVQWDGGGDGVSWSDKENWLGDQLPVDGNAVVISDPAAITVIYDASLGTTHLHSLDSKESLTLTGGNLEIDTFSWNTGVLTVTADCGLTVFGTFQQTGGTVTGDGSGYALRSGTVKKDGIPLGPGPGSG